MQSRLCATRASYEAGNVDCSRVCPVFAFFVFERGSSWRIKRYLCTATTNLGVDRWQRISTPFFRAGFPGYLLKFGVGGNVAYFRKEGLEWRASISIIAGYFSSRGILFKGVGLYRDRQFLGIVEIDLLLYG